MPRETGNGQNTLGYRERMCLLPTGSCRSRKQCSMAHHKAASQASQPTPGALLRPLMHPCLEVKSVAPREAPFAISPG